MYLWLDDFDYTNDFVSIMYCPNSWHHGTITRQEAEELLSNKDDGVFLIRDSVHFQGDYTLSVACDGRVDHYRILTRNNQLEVDGGECTFDSLMSLVEVWSCDCLPDLFLVHFYFKFIDYSLFWNEPLFSVVFFLVLPV